MAPASQWVVFQICQTTLWGEKVVLVGDGPMFGGGTEHTVPMQYCGHVYDQWVTEPLVYKSQDGLPSHYRFFLVKDRAPAVPLCEMRTVDLHRGTTVINHELGEAWHDVDSNVSELSSWTEDGPIAGGARDFEQVPLVAAATHDSCVGNPWTLLEEQQSQRRQAPHFVEQAQQLQQLQEQLALRDVKLCQELRQDLYRELHQELRKELRQDLRQVLRQELRQELRPELCQGIFEELQQA